jgi:sigma-B regulation protein RsbU (phosphoserine phosphatase)
MSDPDIDSTESVPQERMQCMEVRGGNCRTNELFEMVGLRAWVYSRPHGNAKGGGDVYYLSSCASGRITRILLADVSGHGAGVSGIAEGLRELMKRNINYVTQARLVREMNRQFEASGHQGTFATALVCTFFKPTRSLQVSNAGHPSPMIYRQRLRQWTVLDQKSSAAGGIEDVPLGLFKHVDYSETETRLEPGDLLLCCSDALVEALDAAGNQVGTKGLLEIVSLLDGAKPHQLLPGLLSAIAALNPDNLNQDDLTLMLMQSTGGEVPMKNNILSLLRLAQGPRDRTRLA